MNGHHVVATIVGARIPYLSINTEMELLSYSKLSPKEEDAVQAIINVCNIIELVRAIRSAAIKI
jgi:hypothetical protein